MIGKIILHIGKNPSKAKPWLASVIRSILQIVGGSGGRQHSHMKILQFIPTFMFWNNISKSESDRKLLPTLYVFFLENWQFNHRLTPPLLRHMLYWKTILAIWQNMKARGLQKSQFFKWIGKNLEVQPRLLKDANFPSLSWIGKELKVYTAQDRHFRIQILNIWMNCENLCPNLNFTLENKMRSSHEERMATF